ncbi:MAG: DUF1015 domain-containing protein [Spirochaetes bacterium]|nr:DUF1015 domain-containing protein [Spirochaetota bacterium]
MATIHPFKGLRPEKNMAEKITCLPYDVISTEEAREIGKANKKSFLHVIKPEIDLNHDVDLYSDEVYKKGRENLDNLIKLGNLIQDEEASLYVYSQIMGDHKQTGIVACCAVEEYLDNTIRKHEQTRKAKEDDRTKHVDALNANTGPVFLTYMADPDIDLLIKRVTKNKPEYDFTAENGVQHIFHIVNDQDDIKALVELFKDINILYIADGHHRSASAARVYEKRREDDDYKDKTEFKYFLSVLFPHNQMQILPYNRVVRDLNSMDQNTFLKKVSEKFFIEKMEETDNKTPLKRSSFTMYLKGTWYLLKYKKNLSEDPLKGLDVSIMQDYLLDPVLGIKDPSIDSRIDFIGGVHGSRGLERAVDSGDFIVAFNLYPTSILDLINVAEVRKFMPPKSTWFEPKLHSGIITHLLSD